MKHQDGTMEANSFFGGIEAGGTKFVCAVGREPNDLLAVETFLTTTPEDTLPKAVRFFQKHREGLLSIGIGSFGPVDPDPTSSTYGRITSTPKNGWTDTDFAGLLGRELAVPIGFDTDVNAAALGEHRWGAARGLDTFVYMTVGTGVGGGGLVGWKRMRGLVHPEMGHIRVPRADGDDFPGACPFHGDCLEGMTSGPAILARTGKAAEDISAEDPVWALEAHYLAHAVANIACILSPQRVILGGGVMRQVHLFPPIRELVSAILGGYIKAPQILKEMDSYIVPPGLGDQSGVLGALALAEEAAGRAHATGLD